MSADPTRPSSGVYSLVNSSTGGRRNAARRAEEGSALRSTSESVCCPWSRGTARGGSLSRSIGTLRRSLPRIGAVFRVRRKDHGRGVQTMNPKCGPPSGKSSSTTKRWTVDSAHIYTDEAISGAEFERRPGFLVAS
jgi:hypothetical protein